LVIWLSKFAEGDKMAQDDIVVGLDIGTTKIACIIGEINQGASPEQVEIIGVGVTESHGMRKGVVVDVEKTSEAIGQAVAAAQLMAGINVEKVYAGITSKHIQGMTQEGAVRIAGANNEVTRGDVKRALDSAEAYDIPQDKEIIHSIPQKFAVDGHGDIRRPPIGMRGTRLEAYVYIVTGVEALVQNIIRSAHAANLEVEDIVLEPLASSKATLTKDEMEMGVALVDIGGGTTDIIVYEDAALIHTAVLPVGGWHLTNDIAMLLRTPYAEAEVLKKQSGCAMMETVNEKEIIPIPSISGKRKPTYVAKIELAQIIECRVLEMLNLIEQEIVRSNLRMLSGVVLTGGTALLEGLTELAEYKFKKTPWGISIPVRLGKPQVEKGMVEEVDSPIYSTGVGLVLYGAEKRLKSDRVLKTEGSLIKEIINKMKIWFRDYF